LGQWYRGRIIRLVPPVWVMSAAWWFAVLVLDRADALRVGWSEALLTFLGYSPWIGPTWFITLILQLVVFFPVIRWSAIRLGPFVMVPITAGACVWSVRHVWNIVEFGRRYVSANIVPPGFFYYWVFIPRVFWHIVCGIYIAQFWRSRPSMRVTLVGFLVWGAGMVLLAHLPVAPKSFS